MKIVGITRVRNEEHIIKDTLDHVGKLVDQIVVYDDCSTDQTPIICNSHPKVAAVLRGNKWEESPKERNKAEGELRQIAYEYAINNLKADWVYCFDADEFADFSGIDFKADAYRLRLFDLYITEKDKNKSWKERKWMGPEYRDILMLFKVVPGIRFFQRVPTIPHIMHIVNAGYVKHYGKAISVEEWEKTCDYYINNRGGKFIPKFTRKWKARRGKAIHDKSDFGADLITWDEKEKKGYLLED